MAYLFEFGANTQSRTGDLILTKDALYRLSYISEYLERVAGIEPASSAWKAEVLPLYHTRDMPQPGKLNDQLSWLL